MSERESEEVLELSDNAGERYRLHLYADETMWILKLFHERLLVAQVNCVKEGGTLLIGDLRVFDKVLLPQHWLARWLGIERQSRNYRKRGLGTRLLKIVVERAGRHGFDRVVGTLFPRDLSVNPDLPHWYERFGFSVEVAPDGNGGKIRLSLANDDL